MREILFRGKNKNREREWIYGYYGEYYDGRTNVSCISEISKKALSGSVCSYVIPETVGQYTGLKDKNGVKIFEGDIVKYGDTIHKVVFEQRYSTAYFGMVIAENETLPFGHYQDLLQIEILSNIYDNPELLVSETDF